jgi:uncharacterized protein YecT (DUF1311 family)
MRRIMLSILIFACLAQPVLAQEDELDCSDPKDQSTLTQCAGLDFEKADKALNALWPEIKKTAQDMDGEADNGKTEYLDALMASQRAWLAYRDAECIWQGFSAHGGSMEPMLVSGCLAKLTEERVKALKDSLEQ